LRGRSGSAALFFLALAIQAFFTPRAMAFEKTGLLDGIEYRFICTDVAQLKEKINVLVILSRPAGAGGAKKAIRVSLGIPIGAFKPSAGPESLEAAFELGEVGAGRHGDGAAAIEGEDPGVARLDLGVIERHVAANAAGGDRDVLSAVELIGDGAADDARAGLKLPQNLAAFGLDRHEAHPAACHVPVPGVSSGVVDEPGDLEEAMRSVLQQPPRVGRMLR